MEANSWRSAQGDGPAMETAGAVDWRSQLQPEARQRIVNKIMETLKRHLPISVPEGLNELKKIAVRCEEKIYSAATSQQDYLRKLSLKMLSMETKTQPTTPINFAIPNSGVLNQTSSDPASMDSTAQTGHAGATDWQEDCHQKIQSMKELYFTELSEFHQKIAQKLQQHEALMPPGKQSEQYDKLKSFKAMLERTLTLLQISKLNIPVGMKEKLPTYEKQIVTMLQNNRFKKATPQPQAQQFQLPGGSHSMPQQQPSQVTQLQQPDNHGNQLQQINMQGSGSAMQSVDGSGEQTEEYLYFSYYGAASDVTEYILEDVPTTGDVA